MPSSAIARQWNFNLPINALVTNGHGDWVGISMGDGSMQFLRANEAADIPKEMNVHNGVSLSLKADADGHAFLSGGDDGKVFIIDPKLDAPTLLAEHKGQWIDHVAANGESEFRAYSFGKNVQMLNASGEAQSKPLQHPSSIGGLGFSPNGKRLAASHYNGVSLWWTNAKEAVPVKLVWKSSHLHLIWHPDGKILLTSLQENALHGWQLSDNKEMRMQGYSTKIHSMSFTAKGKYLATSGADQVICWPFFGGGPWGKNPLTLGGIDGGSAGTRLVTHVAAHPKDDMVAAGYDDGMMILAPLDGRMEAMIHPPVAGKGHAIVGMAWNKDGDCLFAATESGTVFLFTIDSVRKALVNV